MNLNIKKGQYWKVVKGTAIYKIVTRNGEKWHGVNQHGNRHNFIPQTLSYKYELLDKTDSRVLDAFKLH